jgi:sec-independent protein translocase protein TatA
MCEGALMSAMFAFLGAPGPVELLVVMAILLLLFGHRLPSVMRSLGRGVVEFKKGVQGVEDEFEEAGRSLGNEDKKKDA